MKLIFQGLLTLLMFLGMFLLLHSLLDKNVPTDNKDIIQIVIGYLSGSVSSGIAFWFGTNSSSQEKDKMLYNSTPIEKNEKS